MQKSIFLVIFVFALFNLCFAADESITITTYYPSPYGEYNQLGSNKLAVGDANGNGTLDAADQPNRDGDIRLKAQSGDPAIWPSGTQGQFAYSSMNDTLYHHNGSTWVASGGGGYTVSLKCPSSGGSCTPPTCPAGWTEVLGASCAIMGVGGEATHGFSHGGYCERWCTK